MLARRGEVNRAEQSTQHEYYTVRYQYYIYPNRRIVLLSCSHIHIVVGQYGRLESSDSGNVLYSMLHLHTVSSTIYLAFIASACSTCYL